MLLCLLQKQIAIRHSTHLRTRLRSASAIAFTVHICNEDILYNKHHTAIACSYSEERMCTFTAQDSNADTHINVQSGCNSSCNVLTPGCLEAAASESPACGSMTACTHAHAWHGPWGSLQGLNLRPEESCARGGLALLQERCPLLVRPGVQRLCLEQANKRT